jgi:hypothetical protein
MSSGLVTPQDSIGYWSVTPDRRRSGRFSLDSSGVYGQSNRWSLGTQLSNVSFAECMAPADLSDLVPQPNSDEDKSLGDQIQDWSTVETSDSLFDEYDSIFHPDDEIILDPKESMEAPIKRVPPKKNSLTTGKCGFTRTRTRMAFDRAHHPEKRAINRTIPSSSTLDFIESSRAGTTPENRHVRFPRRIVLCTNIILDILRHIPQTIRPNHPSQSH